MRIIAVILVLALSFMACRKHSIETTAERDNEAPKIVLVTPQQMPVVKAGDILTVKTIMTDNRAVAEASWEVMNASTVCGNSPYQAVVMPHEQSYEMKADFLVPPNFIGNRLMRFTATDNTGNSVWLDVYFTITN